MFLIWTVGYIEGGVCTQLEPFTSRHRNRIGSIGMDGRVILKRIVGRNAVTIYIFVCVCVCMCVLESYDPVAALVNKVMNFRASQKNCQEFIV